MSFAFRTGVVEEEVSALADAGTKEVDIPKGASVVVAGLSAVDDSGNAVPIVPAGDANDIGVSAVIDESWDDDAETGKTVTFTNETGGEFTGKLRVLVIM